MKYRPLEIIAFFYPEDDAFRRMLIKHSTQVLCKAREILASSKLAGAISDADVEYGALLHDIGIGRCNAPSILCTGTEPYISHGVIGAAMLRQFAVDHGENLETYARICERHTGTGITINEIRQQQLPLPEGDYMPETALEKLICLADKFFSKSGDMTEKPAESIRRSMLKFGQDSVERFDEMMRMFSV